GGAFREAPGCRKNFTLQTLRSCLMLTRGRFASEFERFGGELRRLIVTAAGQRQRAARVKQGDVPSKAADIVYLEQTPCAEEEFFSAVIISALKMHQACF